MESFKSVLVVLVGFVVASLMVILALPYLASVGVFGSYSGTITSIGTSIADALPLLAIMVIAGIGLYLFSRR